MLGGCLKHPVKSASYLFLTVEAEIKRLLKQWSITFHE